MADSSVTWDLIARDRASATVGKVGGSVDRLTQRVTHLAAAFGGVFALERAGEFALKMADQFELSRSRLETITKNIGGDFSAVEDQVTSLDDRLAAFGFTNADVEGSVASLETATKNVPKALKDVALAADIARGRNISLEESTRILQRVETGHVSMLSRLGIPTIDATTGKILTQKQALDLLAKTYTGNAANFADTFAGKQEALRAELANTAAEIGVALLPAAVDFARVLQRDVLPPIEHATRFFDQHRKILEPLVGVVIKLGLAWKAYSTYAKIATEIGVGKAATRAAEGTGATALSGASIARPVPVFVTNWRGGAGPVGTAAKTETAAAEAATAEAGLRSRLGAMLPKLGRNVLRGFIIATVADALSSILPGSSGHFVSNVGKGAAAGAVFGPEGAVIGGGAVAVGTGVNAGLNALQSGLTPGDAQSKVIQSLMANGQGAANLAKLQQIATRQMKETGRVVPEVQQEIDLLTKALNGGATAADKHAQALTADGRAALTGEKSLKQYRKELANTQAKGLDLAQGQDDLRNAIHNMAVTVGGQSSRALKGNSDAALANRDALRGAVSQAENYLKVLKDHGASAGHVATVEFGLARAIKNSADHTYGDSDAVHALLKQLGFLPGQIYQVVDAYNALHTAAFTPELGSTRRGLGQFADVPTWESEVKDKAKKIQKTLTEGSSQVIDQAAADAAKKAADAAAAAFDKLKQKAKADAQEITGYFRQEKQSIISTFNDISGSTTDLLGTTQQTPVLAQLRQEARQADQFTRLWLRLADKHLNPRLLDLFQSLGPTAIPTMRLWLNHPRDIRRANRLEARITHDAARITQAETQDKYGKLIHDDLTGLPRKIERGFERALKHAGVRVERDHRDGQRVQHS